MNNNSLRYFIQEPFLRFNEQSLHKYEMMKVSIGLFKIYKSIFFNKSIIKSFVSSIFIYFLNFYLP